MPSRTTPTTTCHVPMSGRTECMPRWHNRFSLPLNMNHQHDSARLAITASDGKLCRTACVSTCSISTLHCQLGCALSVRPIQCRAHIPSTTQGCALHPLQNPRPGTPFKAQSCAPALLSTLFPTTSHTILPHSTAPAALGCTSLRPHESAPRPCHSLPPGPRIRHVRHPKRHPAGRQQQRYDQPQARTALQDVHVDE